MRYVDDLSDNNNDDLFTFTHRKEPEVCYHPNRVYACEPVAKHPPSMFGALGSTSNPSMFGALGSTSNANYDDVASCMGVFLCLLMVLLLALCASYAFAPYYSSQHGSLHDHHSPCYGCW
jgi:hypothetical protein